MAAYILLHDSIDWISGMIYDTMAIADQTEEEIGFTSHPVKNWGKMLFLRSAVVKIVILARPPWHTAPPAGRHRAPRSQEV